MWLHRLTKGSPMPDEIGIFDWQAQQREQNTREMATRIYERAIAQAIADDLSSHHATLILDAAWGAARIFYADARSV
jgi:hypothetical protein